MKPKSFLSCICLQIVLIFAAQLSAQVPQMINYQAKLSNPATGLPIADGEYTVIFSIYDVSTGGMPLWTEAQTIQTTNGIYSVLLGSLNPIDAALFSGYERYLGVAVGSDPEMTPRKQMVSVPYALHSNTANTITGDIIETQTLADVLSQSNNGNAFQIKNIANPTDNQDAVTKAYVDVILARIEHLEFISGVGTLNDVDGNFYHSIRIGTQIWMAENLKTTRYNDGTEIPLVTDSIVWGSLTTPGYCWYNNDEITYKGTCGSLYNWFAVNAGNLCPTGWHVPSDAEWTVLTTYLGEEAAGGLLKEAGTIRWFSPNTGATNETGFTALPCGCRYNEYDINDLEYWLFYGLGGESFWWSSTAYDTGRAWCRNVFYFVTDVTRGYFKKQRGYSIRCVKN